jgi:hypothetical protein
VKRLALIDGDEILHRVGWGSQKTYHRVYIQGEERDGYIQEFNDIRDAKRYIEQDEDLFIESITTSFSKARVTYNTDSFVKTIQEETKSTDLLILFSAPFNYRNNISTIQEYKGNRKDYTKPIHYETIKSHLKKAYPWLSDDFHGLEADDLLAILYNEYDPNKEGKAIICTQDKDLLQVPGWHFNTRSMELFEISEVEGLRNFYKQMYTGDITDNIPGFKEITGKNKSKKHLEYIEGTEKEMYKTVRRLYANRLGAKDYDDLDCILLEIGHLLYMKRHWTDEYNIPT